MDATMAYYESQRSGLGFDPQTDIARTIGRIQQHPQLFPLHNEGKLRKSPARRFPYVIFYLELEVGKIITYAAGLEATYAVLIAEKFRPEHRSALQWLNAHSTESTGFFGITLKVWRIGDSAYAPQLDDVVEPDGWVREVRAASTDKLSGTPLHYRDYWNEFIPEFHEAHPGWSRARTPPKVNWMWFPAGRTGMAYSVSFCRPDKRYQFRLELYIDTGDTEGTAQVFSALVKRRNEIEKIFGESLEWEPLGDRRASRIASYYRDDVRVREREKWPSLRKWAIERMGVFREALQPHLDALDQPGDSGLEPRMRK
jgi:hypothetical protein